MPTVDFLNICRGKVTVARDKEYNDLEVENAPGPGAEKVTQTKPFASAVTLLHVVTFSDT
jgi:hypothetical protein